MPKFNSISVVSMCEQSCRISCDDSRACVNSHAGYHVMIPQCHVTIPLKLNMIFLDLPNASHTHLTVIFLKSLLLFFTSVGHL